VKFFSFYAVLFILYNIYVYLYYIELLTQTLMHWVWSN